MKRICLGWVEPKHDPLDLGEKEPASDPRISHGICPVCEAALLAQEAKKESK